ncbi:MAG: transporter [Clostridiaceae bacterium]
MRKRISLYASYVEIIISILLIVGILISTVGLFKDINFLFQSYVIGQGDYTYESFLADAIQLIIGIEFIKMLAKHSPGSTIDVLLFAVARKIIVFHSSGIELLVEILSIAILFIIRKYFYYKTSHYGEDLK